MAGEATTFPLREGAGPRRARTRLLGRRRTSAAQGTIGPAIALGSILLLSLFIIVMAADRPSLLAPTTHDNFYPSWMAGPLGGLWPGLTGNGTTLKYLFSGSVIAMYLSYLYVLWRGGGVPARWVVATVVAVHALFVLSPPLALTDLFNYVNYGRMEVVHNLNPYTTIPILEPHNDPSYALSNWHELLSPYGPLFTILTFGVVPLGVAGSFWALKVLMIVTNLATLGLVWSAARLLGRDPAPAVALVGLNPVVLVWGIGGDHNDFLMMFFIVLGFYLLLRAREHERARPQAVPRHLWFEPVSPTLIAAGVSFVVAAGLKASALVLAPVVLAGLLRHRRAFVQVLAGMVLGVVLVGVVSLAAFGLHVPDLSTQSRLVTEESLPNLLGLALGYGGETETLRKVIDLALVVSVLACCWLAWRGTRRDRLEDTSDAERTITASGWASVALLATLSWVLPWYVLWLLPLAALSASRRLRALALVFGVYLIVTWMPISGNLWSAIGFHPENTRLGREHQRIVRELLD